MIFAWRGHLLGQNHTLPRVFSSSARQEKDTILSSGKWKLFVSREAAVVFSHRRPTPRGHQHRSESQTDQYEISNLTVSTNGNRQMSNLVRRWG
jgi:hypothetical protein